MTTSTLISGRRAGRTIGFCKAMGWSLRPYQKILMLRLSYRQDYLSFLPPEPWSFDQWWNAHNQKSPWLVVERFDYAV